MIAWLLYGMFHVLVGVLVSSQTYRRVRWFGPTVLKVKSYECLLPQLWAPTGYLAHRRPFIPLSC